MSHELERYCQYASGACPQPPPDCIPDSLFFGYPSHPESSVDAIKHAIELLQTSATLRVEATDWQDLPIEGNVIFCEICRAIRSRTCCVVNVTNANFNVLFEYGFALGTGRALWPLVEEGIAQSDRLYTQLGTMTTVGYSQFANGTSLYKKLVKKQPWTRTSHFAVPPVLGSGPTRDAMGILYLKSPQNNEPSLRITERLSLYDAEIITDDPREVAFQPLAWYLRSLARAYAVVIHIGNDRMESVRLHHAKCALVAGLSLALGRRLLMLGEEMILRPIDYRDLLKAYKNAAQGEALLEEFLAPINSDIRALKGYVKHDLDGNRKKAANWLDYVDLGDYIAENEATRLESYFVETPAYLSSLRPRFGVYVGRKGSGKSANFLMLSATLGEQRRSLVCTIKPKDYELNELMEFVQSGLSSAKQGYLLESLWKYMLYSEALLVVHRAVRERAASAGLSPLEQEIVDYVTSQGDAFMGSFTTRLVTTVGRLLEGAPKGPQFQPAVSEILHTQEIPLLQRMFCGWAAERLEHFAFLVDGLDANWRFAENAELMSDILLGLIGSARDLWRDCLKTFAKCEARTNMSVSIFLRRDIFRVALRRARDPDKVEYELLFWQDWELLMRVVERRLVVSIGKKDEQFNWADLLEPGFSPAVMKALVASKVLPRPRDVLYYMQCVLQLAKSRGTPHLTKRDYVDAMQQYSQHALWSLTAESQPYVPDMFDLLVEFADRPATLTLDEVHSILARGRVAEGDFWKTVQFLVEANFLGYGIDEHNYEYPSSPAEDAVMVKRYQRHVETSGEPGRFRIHNAFHSALNLS